MVGSEAENMLNLRSIYGRRVGRLRIINRGEAFKVLDTLGDEMRKSTGL